MTYAPPEGVTIGTFTANALPATFRAPANSVVLYKIYGSSEGEGVETNNIFNKDDFEGYRPSSLSRENEWYKSQTGVVIRQRCKPNTVYTVCILNYAQNALWRISLTNSENIPGSSAVVCTDIVKKSSGGGLTNFTTLADTKYILVQMPDYETYPYLLENLMILEDVLIAPESYIPFGYEFPLIVESSDQSQDIHIYIGDSQLSATEYVDYESGKIYKLQEGELTPTDPPVSLPVITAYGETTISSTETLGDVEFAGEWTAIMGSTQAESIDIEFTVDDAEEYIAFVTVDDGPSIQVSDTITMPSSADSFTLEVVAWGRERYTDTVYNALS